MTGVRAQAARQVCGPTPTCLQEPESLMALLQSRRETKPYSMGVADGVAVIKKLALRRDPQGPSATQEPFRVGLGRCPSFAV